MNSSRKSLHAILLTVTACILTHHTRAAETPCLVPRPQAITQPQGPHFTLTKATRITYSGDLAKGPAELLAAALRPPTGLPVVVSLTNGASTNTIAKTGAVAIRITPLTREANSCST